MTDDPATRSALYQRLVDDMACSSSVPTQTIGIVARSFGMSDEAVLADVITAGYAHASRGPASHEALYQRAINDMGRYSTNGSNVLQSLISVIAHTFERTQKADWDDVIVADAKLREGTAKNTAL